ncbi:maleylpyruvate isomerase family mycothiol-dependent enzyme [Kocuria indica]|uniref:maleylpyruvate isomerase family mycothiol-dependent enzyme n=1 Tax=Kocuria TaxID=57493 RepID=UPI001EF67CE7|nr:maleylpyruvate isomerase family mycothiol-dependent enzyme [Kocuria indica]MCG7432950.1 maleylpyruvate isomerase family mycothiol-dependent enzyme [Kocuria indica]
MMKRARLNSDLSRLRRETDMFLATVESLSDEEMVGPTLCEGWDRAHVIAHLASSARALVKLIDWATTGEPQQPYESHEAREQEIDELAALPKDELIETFKQNAQFFAEQCERLTGDIVTEELDLHGKPVPATSVPAVRIAEVVVHHHDLDTTWTVEEADPDSLLNAVEAAVRTMRAKGAPGMTLRTEERDEWIIGDGGQLITSDREGMLRWLARGDDEFVESEGALPELPAW